MRILSLGAGVQSSTLALMIAAGEIPMIEAAIFADTQAEPRKVYEWLDWLETQLPFPVHRVTAGSLEDFVLSDSTKAARFMLPTYTAEALGKRQCTRKFKLRPIRSKTRELAGRQKVEQLIGISLDEAWRIKPSGVKYIQNIYPLIDLEFTRQHCIDWLWEHFKRRAPRSACRFCPFLDDRQWAALEADEFEESAKLDDFIRDRGATPGMQQYLHRSRKPLREVDLVSQTKQTDMFINECEGMCGV